MKKAVLTLSLFLIVPTSLSAFTAPAAAAPDIDFSIFFGQPHYHYSPGDGYVLRRGYGGYMPEDRYYRYRHRISCNTAERLVRDRGYDRFH